MAGNALTGAMFSVNKGNTGVGTKKTTFEAIDKGIKGVQDWKDNIDEERLKLKTDTAEKYREAEKYVKENLPTDVTVKNQALRYLSTYKDQLYNNAQLVRNGNKKPEDNLIFQENGKQSFQILAEQVKSFDDEVTKTKERAEGSYVLNEKTGEQVFVKPTSGAYESALQRVQSQISSLESVDVEFGENGMGKLVFYEREFNESTSTMGLKLDNNGNRIPIKGKQNMSVLSLQQGANQRADRLYMADEVAKLVGEKSVLGGTYKEMMRLGNISGVIVDDFRQNPKLKTVLDDAASNLTATVQRRMSILADNPMFNKDGVSVNTILLPFTEYNQLTTAEKAEMQTYSYTDENGVVIHTGKKRKYVQLVVKNNQLLAEEDDNDRLAASRSAKSSLYAGLQKDISGGSPDKQFDPNSASSKSSKKQKEAGVNRVDYANRIAVGGEDAMQALQDLKTSGLFTVSNEFNEILSSEGLVDFDGRKAMKYTVQIDEKGNTEPRYVFTTDKDDNPLSQEERVEQSLALIGTNPLEVKNLIKEFKKSGGILTKVDPNAKFSSVKISGGSRVKYEVTENTDLDVKNIYKGASSAVAAGIDEDVLREGLESYISNTFKDQGLPMPSGFKVETVGNDGMKITGGGITVQTENESESGTAQLMRDFILAYNNRDKESDDPKPGGDVTVKKDAFGNIIK